MFDTKLQSNQARFSDKEEIEEHTEDVDYEKGKANNAGITISIDADGKRGRLYTDDGFYMVVGGTASKKTRDVVAPYIYNNAIAERSMIITDLKGDLYRLMSRTLRAKGYRVVCLNFNDPARGDAYNLIAPIYQDYKMGKKGKANRALNNLAGLIFESVKSETDVFWHNTASSYFVGLGVSLFENYEQKYATIANVFNLHLQGNRKFGGSTYMKKFYEKNQDSEAWKLMVSTVDAPHDTKGGIDSVVAGACNNFMGQNDELMQMMSHSTFEARDLLDRKTAIFLIANEECISVFGGIIIAMIQQWYSMLIDIADQEPNGMLKRKVSFILDEFGNLPALRNGEMMFSLARARGISFMIAIQSFAQLDSRYGRDVADIIIGNTANWIYLHSPDPKLNEYISRLTGTVKDEMGNVRNLIDANQLRRLKKYTEEGLTESLMLLGRMYPQVSYLRDISEYYGIESTECMDIPLRENIEVEDIDFCALVENAEKQKIQNDILERERRKEQENEEKLKDSDPNDLKKIIDNVIAGLWKGANYEAGI